MRRESHVRICERLGVKFPGPTRHPRKIEEAIEIMRAVGREICGGIDVGVDLDWSTGKGGLRYRDKREMAQKMWATIVDVLVSIGALALKDIA
jgi:hypothetical protein